jgi:hypothetical protein
VATTGLAGSERFRLRMTERLVEWAWNTQSADLLAVVRVSRTPLSPENSLLGGNLQGNTAFPGHVQLGLTA